MIHLREGEHTTIVAYPHELWIIPGNKSNVLEGHVIGGGMIDPAGFPGYGMANDSIDISVEGDTVLVVLVDGDYDPANWIRRKGTNEGKDLLVTNTHYLRISGYGSTSGDLTWSLANVPSPVPNTSLGTFHQPSGYDATSNELDAVLRNVGVLQYELAVKYKGTEVVFQIVYSI